MATKKAAAKKKATSLEDQIVEERDEGALWKDISEKHEISVGKAIFIYQCNTVPKDERLEGSDAQLTKAIIKLRNNGMSWSKISARAGRTPGWCMKVYFDNGGDILNVHKGGRYPAGLGRADVRPDLVEKYGEKASTIKSKKKAVAKKPAAKKTTANKPRMSKDPSSMDPEDFAKAVKGKWVTTTDGDRFKVVEAIVSNGIVELTDVDGEDWGLDMSEIAKASAR